MKGFLTADAPEDFEKWLAEQAASGAPAPPPAAAPAAVPVEAKKGS